MFSILGLITGLAGPISAIAGHIKELRLAKLETENTKTRLDYDQQIAEAEVRKSILVAEAGNRVAGTVNATFRVLLALGPASILLKLFLWDKVIGSISGCSGSAGSMMHRCDSFRTDALDVYQWAVITSVIAFYFGYDMLAKSRKNV